MSKIIISNVKTKGLEPIDYYRNPEYQKFGVHDGTSTLVPMYKELLKPVVGDKINETFRDFILSKGQAEQIKSIFEEQIDKTLLIHEKYEEGYPYIHFPWKGKTYIFNVLMSTPKNRRILDFDEIRRIAEECLKENKPMYLTIE